MKKAKLIFRLKAKKFFILQVRKMSIERVYTIVSWNVNGYSDDIHQWLFSNLGRFDILFLTETKKSKEYLETCFKDFSGYKWVINSHLPSHYHGVALLIRDNIPFLQEDVCLGIECRKDSKSGNPAVGRVITLRVDKCILVGSYVPNSGIGGEPHKLEYRISKWDPEFYKYLNDLKTKSPVIWVGDINVALTDIDVSNPKAMNSWAGFRPPERQNFYNFLKCGWIDVWRSQHPQEKKYTWKGNKHHIDNYGLRIDNILVSNNILSLNNIMFDSFFFPENTLSDHIPIGVKINM